MKNKSAVLNFDSLSIAVSAYVYKLRFVDRPFLPIGQQNKHEPLTRYDFVNGVVRHTSSGSKYSIHTQEAGDSNVKMHL